MRGLRPKRLDDMEKMVIDKKNISLKELQREFDISMNTVRSDIDEIIKRGRVKKVYGGVCAIDLSNPLLEEYSMRENRYKEIKQDICKKAKDFIDDGDVIFVDSGTTTIYLADYIREKNNITVLTNNITLINSLLPFENVQVIGLGGRVNPKTRSFASVESLKILEFYNIQKAFMAASALSLKNGAMNSSFDEKSIKAGVIKKAERVYVLCDSSKFENHALLTFCSLEDIDMIISDDEKSEHRKNFKANGINII